MFHDSDIFRQLSLAERLARVSRLWKMAADRELAPLGLTHPRWTALWKLQRLGDHISQKQLACALELELPSLMRTLSQLEEQALITRHSSESDKRTRIVSLTEQGRRLLTQMEKRILDVRNQVLQDVSPQDLELLSTLLEKIAENTLRSLDN